MALLSGVSLTTLQTWLTEAQSALHALSTGKQAIAVGQGDRRVTYTAADTERLMKYIRELQTAIAIAQGNAIGGIVSVATWRR